VKCLLWLQIESVKTSFAAVVKKAFGDVPADWLYKRLCLLKADSDEWINLKKHPEVTDAPIVGFRRWFGDGTLKEILPA
jgi:hypothetical protein